MVERRNRSVWEQGERRNVIEALELARRVKVVLEEKQGKDILLIDVSEQSGVTDFFVLVSGGSSPHLKALLNEVQHALKEQGVNTIAEINMSASETEEDFVARCRAIAEEMEGLVDVFELGNEPNNFGGWMKEYGGTWNGKEPDGSTSGWVKAHLKYTNAGADAIREVRPDATIIGLGAVAPTNFRYLDIGVTVTV